MVRPILYQVGQEVLLTAFETKLEPAPPQPWAGTIIDIKTRIIKSRPAKMYRVKLSNGAEVDALYRQIQK
ncbi:hypothetical protein [Paenibacillus sp. MMO-177]|uniref:hypothetical protein n=1 Tax=Paenibacillus sp. MMO-177 TaxID=3081289 RepID=UPI003018D5A7